MRESIVVLTLLTVFFVMTASAEAQSGASQTYKIVVDKVLGGDTAGKRVYCSAKITTPGMTVQGWRNSLRLPSAKGYLCFVDDMPEANWEHPARLVFVNSANGSYRVYDMVSPPKDFSQFREMGEYVPKARSFMPKTMNFNVNLFNETLQESNAPTVSDLSGATLNKSATAPLLNLGPSHKYAVIINGGYDKYNNHSRYWNDISFMYKVLKHKYGYNPANIYVLSADGTDPAVDRSDGVNSPTDLDGDGKRDIHYAATKANISVVFNQLAQKMNSDDFLFVFTTDHGGQDNANPHMGILYLWNDYINAADFAAQVNKISSYDTMVFAMEQCFSGGFKDYLSGPGRVFMSAAAWNQYSYSMAPNDQYDEFSYYLTCALAGAHPDGGFVNADQDGDGVTSFAEAYTFAKNNDTADETPQYNDQSALSSDPAVGANVISLDGRFGTAFTFDTPSDLLKYSINASFGTYLQVYVKDCGIPGDLWRVSLGNKAPMIGNASGSILNWFSPAVALCFAPRTATVTCTSGTNVFPTGGYIKFVLHGTNKKKMTIRYK